MSSSIRIRNLRFGYRDNLEIFSDLSINLTAGWTGLVGPNGAGKTTLLGLIAGQLTPSQGSVHFPNGSGRARICAQRVDEISDDIQALASGWDNNSRRLMSRLGLDERQLERWHSLSPGERKRWQVAAAMVDQPILLALDEPTNHLDSAAFDLVLHELRQFRAVGLLVSHDRRLLDELCSHTLRVDPAEPAGACLYSGCYTTARESWTAEQDRRLKLRAGAKRTEARARRQAHEKRQQAESAQRGISARGRVKGPRDSDGRSLARKARAQHAAAKLSTQAGARQRHADRAAKELARQAVEVEVGRGLFVDYQPAPKSRLLTLNAPGIYAGPKRLLGQVSLAIERCSRIHLAGPNGAGKTTLLEHLLACSSLPPERVLHLPQDLPAGRGAALLDETRKLPNDERARVLQIVAALGVSPDRLLASELPSPGEARKLALAYGLGRQVWLAILDEPTNHLDLPSVERLEHALESFPGALIAVSHDARFAHAVTKTTWTVLDGEVRLS